MKYQCGKCNHEWEHSGLEQPKCPACELAAPAGSTSELETLRNENRELRIMCAIAHAGLALYTDDGELQDNREQPAIDWKRDAIGDIERKLHERYSRRLCAENERRQSESNDQASRQQSGQATG